MPPKCHFGTAGAKNYDGRHVACPPPFFSDRAEIFLGGYWVENKVRLRVSRFFEQKAPPSGPSAKIKFWAKLRNPSQVKCLSKRVLGGRVRTCHGACGPTWAVTSPYHAMPRHATLAHAREQVDVTPAKSYGILWLEDSPPPRRFRKHLSIVRGGVNPGSAGSVSIVRGVGGGVESPVSRIRKHC